MVKGFKDFILRGNVVDLAVAVVIGVAFGALVSTFVGKIVTPILNALPGAKSTGLGFSIRGGLKSQATYVDISAIINAVIVFVVTALVIYLLFVVPMNRLAERRKRGVEPEPEAPAEDILLLQEIRDLLAGRGGQQV
jgi:large conductance mechanosensitive channel